MNSSSTSKGQNASSFSCEPRLGDRQERTPISSYIENQPLLHCLWLPIYFKVLHNSVTDLSDINISKKIVIFETTI